MKLSKSKVISFLIIIALFSFKIFFLNPFLKRIYFSDDIRNFEKNSWKYSLVLPSILLIIAIIFAIKRKLADRKFFINCIIVFLLITVFSKRLTDDLLLYFNSKINVENYTKNYIVLRYDPNKVFHIYDKKNEFIVFDEQLKKIDSVRLKRNLKSLYNLQNKDTLNVEYKVGMLKVKYLE